MPGAGDDGNTLGAQIGEADHRLRRATLDDKMCFDYTPSVPGSIKVTQTVPIFDPNAATGDLNKVMNMTVQILNFADQTRTGNRNISPASTTTINAAIAALKARYAICGINVIVNYNSSTDIINETTSTAPNLNAIGDAAFSDNSNYQTLKLSDDMSALLNEPAVASRTFNSNTIIIIFIGGFATTANTGESFPDGWISATTTPKAKNTTWIGSARPSFNALTVCHEVGHMVTNANLTSGEANGKTPGWANGGHYGGTSDAENLMYPIDSDLVVTGRKRLWDDTAIHIVQQISRIRGTHYITTP